MKSVVLICILAAAAAFPQDTVLSIDQEHHKHDQQGTPGDAVTGSYSFIASDGTEHIVTYIADDKGYRVVGDSKVGAAPAPTAAPVRRTTTLAPKPAPTPALKAAVQLVQLVQPVHLLPVQPAYTPISFIRTVQTPTFNVITSNLFDGQFRGLPIFLNRK